MPRKKMDELGALQRAVMEVLWDREECTVQEVRDAVPAERKPAYTTILSVLQKLEKFGWVGHRSEGRTYVYAARRSRGEEGSQSLRSFVDRVFGGDPALLFQHLIEDQRLDAGDLEALEAMIDARRRELGDDR